MRIVRTIIVACLLLAVPACMSSNKGKIEGTKWSSVASSVKGKPIPAGALELEFGRDGSLVYRAGPQTFTGKYSLGMGSTVTFNLTQELAGRKSHAEKITISGNSMTVTDSDGTSLTFTKVN